MMIYILNFHLLLIFPFKEGKKAFIKTAINHLRKNCYFNVCNVTVKQAISIPVGIDSAYFGKISFQIPMRNNRCHYYFLLIKSRQGISTQQKRFIDELCVINDSRKLSRSFCDIYPKELKFKVEHQVDHVTFLNLDINIKEGTFIYKLFHKRDLLFPFQL